MFKPSDPYTYTLTGPLQQSDGTSLGLFTARYRVTHYDDVQLATGTAQTGAANGGARKYILHCTQRISVYNPSGMNLSPQMDLNSYADYPALLNTQMALKPQQGAAVQLLGYAPQTVNTQVQTAGTLGSSTGQTSSSSTSSTIGSSTAQTNSYSISVGSFGDAFTSSASYEHSTTVTQEHSATTGRETGHSNTQDNSSSASMSIKDWGAYSLVNPATSCPSWTFGQEYPWDAVACRKTTGSPPDPNDPNKVQLVVPSAMTVRLYDGVSLYPPSHLSMFGYSFVMSAQWLVTIPSGQTDQISLQHVINHFTASHVLNSSAVLVSIDKVPTIPTMPGNPDITSVLDLGVLALDPLGNPATPAVVGFVPAKFTTLPAPAAAGTAPVPFSIFATTNTLLVRDTTTYPASCPAGAGFSASPTALAATLVDGCASLTFTLLFKVIDATTEYTLHLKHWKTSATNLMLTIVVNGDTANALTKYVDAQEAEGGENNLLSITLRNLDFASVDYSDLLALGLNSVAITVAPVTGSSGGYALRAVSIEAA